MSALFILLFVVVLNALHTPAIPHSLSTYYARFNDRPLPQHPFNSYWSASPYLHSYSTQTYPDGRRELYPCHNADRPADKFLHCSSSPYQIMFIPGSDNRTHAKQKENLIVFDIDQTILDSHEGSDGPIFYKYARFGEGITFNPDNHKDLKLTCLQDPHPYSIVFRKHFFEFLDYVHKDIGFSADLMIYTRARVDYTANIVFAINAYYHKNYRSKMNKDEVGMPAVHESLFKAVISSTTEFTAKTISTLHHVHYLNLANYENIIILDHEADAVWCKHDMIQLKLRHHVNIALIQVPSFSVWRDVYRRWRSLTLAEQYGPNRTEIFYDLIAENQESDLLFVRFHDLLESMNHGDPVQKLSEFAASIPNQRICCSNGDVLRKLSKMNR